MMWQGLIRPSAKAKAKKVAEAMDGRRREFRHDLQNLVKPVLRAQPDRAGAAQHTLGRQVEPLGVHFRNCLLTSLGRDAGVLPEAFER